MARIRTIKPDFWKDYDLATQHSRDARLLYIGMWNFADDHGVLEGPPERIKAEIFPYESVNVRKLLSELIQSKRVLEYQSENSTYFWLTKLNKHQKLDRPRESNLPMPSDEIIRNHMISDEISCTRARAVVEGKVREGISKGSEEGGNSSAQEQSEEPLMSFDEFWDLYPRKKSKGQAEKAWKGLNPNTAIQERISQALFDASRSQSWLKEGGKFIPYPATWLHAKGWEDEVSQ